MRWVPRFTEIDHSGSESVNNCLSFSGSMDRSYQFVIITVRRRVESATSARRSSTIFTLRSRMMQLLMRSRRSLKPSATTSPLIVSSPLWVLYETVGMCVSGFVQCLSNAWLLTSFLILVSPVCKSLHTSPHRFIGEKRSIQGDLPGQRIPAFSFFTALPTHH